MLSFLFILLISASAFYNNMVAEVRSVEPVIPVYEEVQEEQPLFELQFKDGQDVTEYITTPEREKEAKIESNIMHFKDFLNSGNPLKPEFAEIVAKDLSDLGCDLIIKDYDFDIENNKFIVEDINDQEFIIYLKLDDNGNYIYDYSEKYEKVNENTVGNSVIFNKDYVKTFPLSIKGVENVKILMNKLRLSNDDAIMLVLEFDKSDFGLVKDGKLNAITRGETGERIIHHYILTNENGQEKEILVDVDQNSSNGSKFNFVIKN